MRKNTATEKETAKYHKDSLDIRLKELQFKSRNGGQVKDQQAWLNLAQDMAKTDETSFARTKDGEIKLLMDALGQTKPVIDPAKYEANVRKHGTNLNKEHKTRFIYGGQTKQAPAGGNSDPLGIR